jgi:hypothetical protein
MIDKTKLARFMKRLDGLIAHLESRKDSAIHQKINQFYYMQKREELKLLMVQLDEAERRPEKIADMNQEDCKIFFNQWCLDTRWLNTYQRNQNSKAVL